MAKTLQMTFATAAGKTMMLTVDEPREDLTPQAVKDAMEAVIATQVFEINGYPLSAIKSAAIVDRTATTLIHN